MKANAGTSVLSNADYAELRVRVYHDAIAIVFESLMLPARNGAPMECGDGKTRIFRPVIGAVSADYKEL